MSEKRAITIKQPYASAILADWKRYETRSWVLPSWMHGQTVILHAGKGWVPSAHKFLCQFDEWELRTKSDYIFGAAIGEIRFMQDFAAHRITVDPINEQLGDYSEGMHAWHIDLLRKYKTPIPVKGQLGFWKWSTFEVQS